MDDSASCRTCKARYWGPVHCKDCTRNYGKNIKDKYESDGLTPEERRAREQMQAEADSLW